ncbi:hypothetical protein [Enhygromyxa salina]|nr:hypothetical protein [Enhygromyxa salina]
MQSTVVKLGGLGLIGLTACLGPNPRIDAGELGSESATSDPGHGDPGDGDGDTSDGDTSDTSDTDTDTGTGDPTPTHCDNQVLDGDETDVDCGGSCSGCAPGAGCLEPGDCEAQVCEANVCAAPTCVDGVHNGDEIDVDCGANCRFCTHSEYIEELDDVDDHVIIGDVAMFEDGVFAVLYLPIEPLEFQLRWFDEFAMPISDGLPASSEITLPSFAFPALAATGELDTHLVYAAISGEDATSTSKDVFAVGRGPDTPESHWSIYKGPVAVTSTDIGIDGDVATVVWEQNGEVFLRRYNYALNIPVGLATRANPDFALRPGDAPTLAQRNGLTVVAWIVCEGVDNCDVELRSFEFDWIEDAPVALNLASEQYVNPQLAIAEDDRVAVVFGGGDNGDRKVLATLLNPGLTPNGVPWLLQGGLTGAIPSADVVALDDGSFAFAWPDETDNRVHIRRFVGPELPVVTDVGDEAPWPATNAPVVVRLAASNGLVTAVWGAGVDDVFAVQGQVLSY